MCSDNEGGDNGIVVRISHKHEHVSTRGHMISLDQPGGLGQAQYSNGFNIYEFARGTIYMEPYSIPST